MDSSLLEPENAQKFNHPRGLNYEKALNQSIQALLDTLQNSKFEDLPVFISSFRELLQHKIDPPLETIWVYSALAFHNSNSLSYEPLKTFSAISDLFQLIASYSASCNSLKSIVLITPVIYNLHKLIQGFNDFELGDKKKKKLLNDIKALADSILGYINVCCEGLDGNSDGLEYFIRRLKDLISLWIWDQKVQNGEDNERLKLFFPLLGEDMIEKVSVEGVGCNELAGHVIAEAIFLKLCLSFRGKSTAKELQSELRAWVVGSITGLQNPYFFDSLVKMLLEPSLPVKSLLSSEDELSLRKVLYDAVILVEYSFLNPERLAHLPAGHAKSIAMGRLMVTHEAVDFFREQQDQTKALAYMNVFSASSLPYQLTKWVKSETGINADDNGPSGSSPKAFLRWILNIENQGIKIFDDDMSTYRDKLVFDDSEQDFKLLANKENKKKSDTLFYIDNKGDQEDQNEKDEKMTEAISAEFVAAAHSLLSVVEHGGKKRKAKHDEKKSRPKFLKYNLHEESSSSREKPSLIGNEGSSSGSEVENPSSDED